MMRPHCDRCDALCDEYQTWMEDQTTFPLESVNATWHIEISIGSLVRGQMFCRACRIVILEGHVKELKLVKGDGGHLAACRWDTSHARYVCAEGCEIKRINEKVKRA